MYPVDDSNPFAPIRAADYTDKQINELWVELGSSRIATILEPRSLGSKYILGSKGSGKTHLLRYQSYQVARQRWANKAGLSIVESAGCLAVFLRTTNIDAPRFEMAGGTPAAWQQLFSIHLELRLAELVLDALQDIKGNSTNEQFDDKSFLGVVAKTVGVSDDSFHRLASIEEFQGWTRQWLHRIDDAINAAAFSGRVELHLPFSIGGLCLPIGAGLKRWHPLFEKFHLIYILDEIENLAIRQQEVVNTLVRYAEGRATFRLTGRLYARKTLATVSQGEENREGSEFSVNRLDEILRSWSGYTEFARKFIAKRMSGGRGAVVEFDPRDTFEEINLEKYIAKFPTALNESRFVKLFRDAAAKSTFPKLQDVLVVEKVIAILTTGFPPLFQRLNILLFCKKLARTSNPESVAYRVKEYCVMYLGGASSENSYYRTAVGHWKLDLFAQLCRESKRHDALIPYAGFHTLVTMSSHNPRNLLVLLAKIYEIANFKEIDLRSGKKLPVEIQSEAVIEAARFTFESDSNYGQKSDLARDSTRRLAEVLRTARYALNIPEVSPLAVSFNNDELTLDGRQMLEYALNYSLVHEIHEGRVDRNNQLIRRKIQLSPMLSARWALPIARRGDISLSGEVINSIFDPRSKDSFEHLLRQLHGRWNLPFTPTSKDFRQEALF
jgi:hypothetical protein